MSGKNLTNPDFLNGAKANGVRVIDANDRVLEGKITVSTLNTAAAITYTAAQLLGGLLLRDPNGSNRSDVLPTAASLVEALERPAVGTAFEFTIRNTADAAETITVTAGTGATISGTATIAQNNSKRFLVVLTNTLPGQEAYTIYSLGTIVH